MPKIQEIEDAMLARFSAVYGQQVPLYKNSFLRVVAKVVAGALAVAYQFISYNKAQARIKTASMTPETFRGTLVSPLVEWGRMVGLGDPVPASQAVLIAQVVNEYEGAELPAGSILESSQGVRYTTTEDAVFTNHVAQVSCTCDEVGEVGNDITGDFVVIAPPAGIRKEASILTLHTAGVESETEVEYRSRLLAWWQRRALGGALADYWTWAMTVAGIVNAYPTRGDAGVVEVRVQASESSSGNADGIPTEGQLAQVLEAIEYDPNEGITPKANRRPVGSSIQVLPITMKTYDVTVHGVAGVGDRVAFETRLNTHLTKYFNKLEPFIFGLTPAPRQDTVSVNNVTAQVAEITGNSGGLLTRLDLASGGNPVYAETLNTGKAKLGTLTINYAEERS